MRISAELSNDLQTLSALDDAEYHFDPLPDVEGGFPWITWGKFFDAWVKTSSLWRYTAGWWGKEVSFPQASTIEHRLRWNTYLPATSRLTPPMNWFSTSLSDSHDEDSFISIEKKVDNVMRFSCKRTRLAEVASLVGQAVSGKSTKRIFECIRLEAKGSTLELAGTDLEVAVRYTLTDGVKVEEEGVAVVPAQLFAGILREIGDEQVSLKLSNQKLTLETDGGFFEMECEEVSQFPEIPTFSAVASGRIPAADLRALVKKTTFAAGKEATRFVLNGVRIHAMGNKLSFVATDGRRLAFLERGFDRRDSEGKPFEVIVGVKGLQHFDRVTASAEDPVEIALADRFVALRTNFAEVTARAMDGSFPEINQIIPSETTHEAKMSVNTLAARLRQVSQFASVESQAVVLTFNKSELGISAAGGDGRADVKMNVEYDGPEEKIGFNPAYLLDALKVVDGERLTFSFSNRNAAAKITDEAGFMYVIMPVLID